MTLWERKLLVVECSISGENYIPQNTYLFTSHFRSLRCPNFYLPVSKSCQPFRASLNNTSYPDMASYSNTSHASPSSAPSSENLFPMFYYCSVCYSHPTPGPIQWLPDFCFWFLFFWCLTPCLILSRYKIMLSEKYVFTILLVNTFQNIFWFKHDNSCHYYLILQRTIWDFLCCLWQYSSNFRVYHYYLEGFLKYRWMPYSVWLSG